MTRKSNTRGSQPTNSLRASPRLLARSAQTWHLTAMKWWKKNQQKLKDLFEEYGRVAFGTYVALWAAVLVGYAVAIKMGVQFDGAAETSGILFAAWVTVKATQPVRIAITVLLTPFVARLLKRAPNNTPVPAE